jgi:hypothetical protein
MQSSKQKTRSGFLHKEFVSWLFAGQKSVLVRGKFQAERNHASSSGRKRSLVNLSGVCPDKDLEAPSNCRLPGFHIPGRCFSEA